MPTGRYSHRRAYPMQSGSPGESPGIDHEPPGRAHVARRGACAGMSRSPPRVTCSSVSPGCLAHRCAGAKAFRYSGRSTGDEPGRPRENSEHHHHDHHHHEGHKEVVGHLEPASVEPNRPDTTPDAAAATMPLLNGTIFNGFNFRPMTSRCREHETGCAASVPLSTAAAEVSAARDLSGVRRKRRKHVARRPRWPPRRNRDQRPAVRARWAAGWRTRG